MSAGSYCYSLQLAAGREGPDSGAQVNPVLVGLCTGSLAAAAISCSGSVIDMVQFGIESVLVAFWVGMHASRKARALSSSDKPWALTIAGIMLTEFEKAIQPYWKTLVCSDTCAYLMQGAHDLFFCRNCQRQ